MAESISKEQIKTIWGLSKEVDINKEELYCIIARIANKESMKELTKLQANKVVKELIDIKEKNNPNKSKYQKRTDSQGRKSTQSQRAKIYQLTGILGWNNNNNRINGFIKKIFKVDRIEWLTSYQCIKLIEMLKKMILDRGLGEKME